MHIFIAMIALMGYVAADDNPQAVADFHSKVNNLVQIEKNVETGLTDFTVVGYDFSLELQDVRTTTFND
jgi:hypothetical protein